MKQILKFNSPKGHYTADACVVWCFDERFGECLERFIKGERFVRSDNVVVGGGAKSLASKNLSEREFLLGQIKISLKLHGTKTVVLMLHSDCGAYGGLAGFEGDKTRERSSLETELRSAKSFLKENLPASVKIKLVFADFEGVYEV
ncbi:MAG: hypothetical protein Q7S36_01370 [Candidatus Liptonbacteria bacterium]|nr:hypothetical protein [Candidatus Liptonbacteria bacterium]